MNDQIETVRLAINMSLIVIRMYDWLLDLYVLDFFVDNHWEKLPQSWRESFQNIDPPKLGAILSGKQTNHVFPLSFLALISSVKALSLPRESISKSVLLKNNENSHSKLKNLFLKHVKLKKRHEITLMADVVSSVALESNCEAVIDFGSGLGHLVRMLTYKNNLYVAGIECQSQLIEGARKLDSELEYTAGKHLSEETMAKLRRPIHFNINLSSHEQLCKLQLPDTMREYGLVGLHPCGELGPLLLRHFVECDDVKFICVVGCCYMKLTCDEGGGYPLSDYVKSLNHKLSYASREIACHAVEVYCERLRKGNYEDLKIHAYRAALERILIAYDTELKHAPVRSIKHCCDCMSFEKYCALALERLAVPLPSSPLTWSQGRADLALWRRVVTVYTLRLALAPLVETVLLLDRVLYVLEHDLSCEIRPEFDPKISPRNHVIIARRL